MSSDFAISATPPHAVTTPVSPASASTTTQASHPDPAAVTAASKRPLANPSLHLDLALNLVVLQFVDDNGNVTSSFPSAKQIKAYKDHEAEPATKSAVQAKS